MSPSVPGSQARARLFVGAAAAIIAAGMATLFFFDPVQYHFYPVCPLHQWTGWSCPGCGTLRALHQLTHGNFLAAWRFNPLTVCLIPVALWLGAREAAWHIWGLRWPGIVTRPAFGWTLAAVAILFGIARNLP